MTPLPTSGGVIETSNGVIAGSAGGGGPTVLESFDSESLADYNGDPGEFTFTTSPAWSGSALTVDGGGVSQIWTTSKGSFSKGEEATLYIQTTNASANNQEIDFALSDANNHYRAQVDWANSTLRLRVVDGGNSSVLSSTGFSFSTGTWYVLRITRHDSSSGTNNQIIVAMEQTGGSEIASISATDSTHASATGFGFADAAASGIFFDELVKQSL